ncbi:DNA polymerase IV [Acidothermaceae bacterium B102]|nr:DNA polymerase IV [Acidothermaceae bacterium B102]
MRPRPVILHLDLDAFFAAVEQRDKPSLRGKPVVVGGTGPRGVVSTASYEARRYGVHSAMSGAEARRRCPNAAFLHPRFGAYRMASDVVMSTLRELSPLIEPLSLDEAYVDLSAGEHPDLDTEAVREIAVRLRRTITERTGLTASVGAGSSKLVAKIASDLDKPDGLLVVPPGDELTLLHGLPVTRLWGVGPATAQRLQRLGVTTVAELAAIPVDELIGVVGQSVGAGLAAQARAEDDRPVVADRETKSVASEETFDTDVADVARLRDELDLMANRTARRLRSSGHSARTVTLKVRLHDFRTLNRSLTLPGATDDEAVIRRVVRRLLAEVDVSDGVRLLGVACSGLSDHVQDELPDLLADPVVVELVESEPIPDVGPEQGRRWGAGLDVVHTEHGPGWVHGSGVGRVTVRFEGAHDPPGRVRTFSVDDPELRLGEPVPFVPLL